jgi:hypothetical protein
VGRLFPFLADAISYVVSVVSLLFIKTPFQQERRTAPQKLWVEIKEGFFWLWHHPLLRFMTLLVGSLNFTVAVSTWSWWCWLKTCMPHPLPSG